MKQYISVNVVLTSTAMDATEDAELGPVTDGSQAGDGGREEITNGSE